MRLGMGLWVVRLMRSTGRTLEEVSSGKLQEVVVALIQGQVDVRRTALLQPTVVKKAGQHRGSVQPACNREAKEGPGQLSCTWSKFGSTEGDHLRDSQRTEFPQRSQSLSLSPLPN